MQSMKKLVLSSAILSILSFGALADTPSFNFLEIGYTDSFDSEVIDGYEVNGSFELNESFFLSASYTKATESKLIDLDGYQFGLGYKSKLSDSSVWFTQIDYVKIDNEFDLPGFSASISEDGYQLSLGVKNNISKSLELSAAIKYIDIVEDDTYTELGAVYNFTDSSGVYFNIETDFDDSNYAIGLRMSF
jgi:opacity protein-like surface antigen